MAPARKRPRPHPARRARRIAGAASVAGMFVLTGCMAATTKTKTVSGAATTATETTPTTSASDWYEDDDSSAALPSPSAAAASGTVSSLTDTSTHAS